ncbi:redoxin domain-containing protein [Cognatiyoonia sp. IB215182]|uniref:redoxin domain-containing protein n=1 Tax=Cognatiyoonia sp. IB215182 TaxID=3097353 RepID=UPI002A11FD83|nr:redoxin domain-containing protein [Cognatiyoonia sp. IB215182]MDX8355362.1 redoxin domain-containing protein [Cognatiyoonia sp. IB215182]
MAHDKPKVGAPVGPLTLPMVGKDQSYVIGGRNDRWTMLFVYRGRHCPRCKRFLNKLNAALSDWRTHMDVVVASADPADKATADRDEHGWAFDLCYGMNEEQMRNLGLYVSVPLSEAETDNIFAEPGAFAIRPEGTLMLVDISNGPAARPDLDELLDGMIFNITNDRPVRGTA